MAFSGIPSYPHDRAGLLNTFWAHCFDIGSIKGKCFRGGHNDQSLEFLEGLEIQSLQPIADTYVDSQTPDKNFGVEPLLQSHFEPTSLFRRNAYLKYELSAIPADAVVTDASLILQQTSVHTVRDHIRRIYKKLQVHSAAEAVSRAVRKGLI